jgi:spore germination protein YaaH
MLVLTPKAAKAIAKIEERELDLKRLQQMPGIVGYIVRPGDSLWKIAKKYYTTMDSIRKLNENITEDLKPGTRLIVMKEIEESLG